MTAGTFKRVSKEAPPSRLAARDVDPEPRNTSLAWLPWGVFALLYPPLIYWSGFALKALGVIDFPGIYLGARLTFVDHKTPYGYAAFDDYAVAYDRWIAPFVYPPPSLIALWPLSIFPIRTAFILFTIVSHLCLLGMLWLILRRLMPLPGQRLIKTVLVSACLAYILLSDAVAATLNLGQINIVVTFFICLFLAALIENKSAWRMAWPLSLAILLKTYPLLLIVLLVIRRKFTAAALTLGVLAVFLGLAIWILPPEIWSSFKSQVLPAAMASSDEAKLFSHSNVSFTWNQSVTGFFTKLFGDLHSPLHFPGIVGPLTRLTSALMVVVTSVFAFRARQRDSRLVTPMDDAAAFLLLMYLVAPVSWDHHLVFILPAAVLALLLILNGSVTKPVAIVLGVALCLIAWRMYLDAPMLKKGWWSLLACFKFFSVIGLWVFFTRRLYKAGLSVASNAASL